LAIIKSEADPVRWLGSILRVEFPDDAEILLVSCTTKDPKEAATLTKAVVDAYMAEIDNAEMRQHEWRYAALKKIVDDKERELHHKLEMLNQLSAMLAPDDAKAAKKPVSVEVQMLRFEVDIIQEFIREVRMDLERMKVEIRAPLRISVLERAEVPLTPN
jgi:hypothetical protein